MPMYDFECQGCHQIFEKNVPIAERDDCLNSCTLCGHSISIRIVTFKGGVYSPTANGGLKV